MVNLHCRPWTVTRDSASSLAAATIAGAGTVTVASANVATARTDVAAL